MEVIDELKKMFKESYNIHGKLEDIAIKMVLCTMILYNLYIAVVLGVVIKGNLFLAHLSLSSYSFFQNLALIYWNVRSDYRTASFSIEKLLKKGDYDKSYRYKS